MNQIALIGEWDLARKEELSALFAGLSKERPATIDLRACTYADSTVLSALALLKAAFADVPITLLGPTLHMDHLLRIVDFQKLFRIVDAQPER